MPARVDALGDIWADLHRRGRSVKAATAKVKARLAS
jgi:hypothetical protein